MKDTLAADLLRQCPRLYGQLKPGAFKCGDGWFDILLMASLEIENALPESGKIYADAVYEKYGSLRLDLNRQDDALDAIIQKLEQQSEQVCENCGAAGSLVTNSAGWEATRCGMCKI